MQTWCGKLGRERWLVCQQPGSVEENPQGNGGAKGLENHWYEVDRHQQGDDQEPKIRCRFAGTEFNAEAMDGLFAGTPPLEAFRFLIHEAATVLPSESTGSKVVMINDVARALFEAPAIRYMCGDPQGRYLPA